MHKILGFINIIIRYIASIQYMYTHIVERWGNVAHFLFKKFKCQKLN